MKVLPSADYIHELLQEWSRNVKGQDVTLANVIITWHKFIKSMAKVY
jgi:hypothetical protein